MPCVPGTHPGSTSGMNPGGQRAIPRQFKRKKNFVTHGHRTLDGRTDRRVGRNSDLDEQNVTFQMFLKTVE